MSKVGGVVIVILSLVAGFGGGAAYSAMYPGGSTAAKTSSSASTATTQTLTDCLKGVWGADKYAAITANSALATTQDNFAALKCYQSK